LSNQNSPDLQISTSDKISISVLISMGAHCTYMSNKFKPRIGCKEFYKAAVISEGLQQIRVFEKAGLGIHNYTTT